MPEQERPVAAGTQASDEQAIVDMLIPRGSVPNRRAAPRQRLSPREGARRPRRTAAAIALMVAVRGSVNEVWWFPTGALGVALTG